MQTYLYIGRNWIAPLSLVEHAIECQEFKLSSIANQFYRHPGVSQFAIRISEEADATRRRLDQLYKIRNEHTQIYRRRQIVREVRDAG